MTILKVVTTNNCGLSVEHWANRCLERIIFVGDQSDSVISDQARAFREEIRSVIAKYMSNAIVSDRTTLYNLFIKQGHNDMAEILRKL
jgi:hypothetical protein